MSSLTGFFFWRQCWAVCTSPTGAGSVQPVMPTQASGGRWQVSLSQAGQVWQGKAVWELRKGRTGRREGDPVSVVDKAGGGAGIWQLGLPWVTVSSPDLCLLFVGAGLRSPIGLRRAHCGVRGLTSPCPVVSCICPPTLVRVGGTGWPACLLLLKLGLCC